MGDTPERKRSVAMENVEEVKKKSKGKESRYGKRYGFEFKLRCVKLRLHTETSTGTGIIFCPSSR